MFVVHKFSDQFLAPPQESSNIQKYIAHEVFRRYMFKFCKVGYCTSIININILNNVIMRQTANLFCEVFIQAMFIELKEGDYIEGKVTSMNQNGIKIQFLGCLVGSISELDLHEQSVYLSDKQKWIYQVSEYTGPSWQIGDKIRAKILILVQDKGSMEMQNIIKLRANEPALGPARWWSEL